MRISPTATATSGPPWAELTLEVAGGTLRWGLLDGADAQPRLHAWAPESATWLWRIVGEQGHVNALETLTDHRELDVATAATEELALLRRLAWGHWLRRWWPTSVVDGIDALPAVVLDVEVALLTGNCDAYFDETSFDGDPHAVLVGHDEEAITALAIHSRADVRDLHRRWLDYETGETEPAVDVPAAADDYALAAGPGATATPPSGIFHGRASVAWESVPAHTFDAAEDTISWTVDAAPDAVIIVEVALLPDRAATSVRVALSLADPPVEVSRDLDPKGRVRIELPITAAQAWQADWSGLVCTAGGVAGARDRDLRDRVRALVRRRIGGVADPVPLYVAEQIVADANY
ncbi:MAG TPA: hypothetical protein PK331_05700 [Gordonia sp. (in: high G+C Gram-positive bacteria)]|uniref:hypothetical protein n=1 Tax=unclassified Gordonia (in: high G+C Gram-positive bacteria) TaxID=2657482 RepID=UPI000FA122DD|nr:MULTISPECIES: hypothetical protein [unclassified Gordonia (in: high G+C Gram-positive bacteria)]RUP36769.1 MAG: hypothetical protein EKK60_14080 [Gordonia sp. (in: high G+C Gram-positive bacteria)]HNP56961.1 hypothetical protein [Gordonia sp. (in: high G+C Gram-positive bacteria)]HRC50405.1 hypothetical protein [Gordonia sp. (in: high G+C Gram-positive bacteria)]